MLSIRLHQLLRFTTFSLPLIMLLTVVALLRSPGLFTGSEGAMYRALTLDLTLSIPLVYFLVIRKRSIPNLTVVPVFILGIVIASLLVPQGHQQSLELIKTWVFPLVELGVFSLLVYKVVSLKKAFAQHKNKQFDFIDTFRMAADGILPKKAIGPFTTEASMFYYALFTWKKPTLAKGSFSYHKNSGVQALLFALLMAVVIETAAIHFLVIQWSVAAAWILSALSVYTGLQVFAYIKSIPRRPTTLEQGVLTVRNGLMGSCKISLSNIQKIEVFKGDLPQGYEDIKKMSLFYQNVVLHLQEEVSVEGLYGITKRTNALAFYIDDLNSFEAEVGSALKQ